LGVNFQFVHLPFRWDRNKIGFGFSVGLLDYYFIKNEEDENGIIEDKSILDYFRILDHILLGVYYQRAFDDLYLGAHAAFGIASLYHHDEPFLPAINLGASALYFFGKEEFVKLDLNMTFMFDKDKTNAVFRPTILFGRQFDRNNETGLRLPGSGLPMSNNEEERLTRTGSQFILSLGWAPVIRYNRIIAQDMGYDYDLLETFNPTGFNVLFAWMPHHFGQSALGYELEVAYFDFPERLSNNFILFRGVYAGIRYQWEHNNSLYFNARAAIGFAAPYSTTSDKAYIKIGDFSTMLGVKFGASAQWFIWNNLFIEAGMDVSFIISDPTRVLVIPGLSMGWQFGR